jgi:choline dehydrogenase
VATRVLFDGRQAIGVEYQQGGGTHVARAGREVVLAAGPIKSPQLLELSGIGDGRRLQELGIATVQHLPGVGENLSDHLQSRITFEARNATTLNELMGSRWRQYLMGAGYLLHRRGLMATPSCTVHALAASVPGEQRPDVKLQIHHLSSKDRLEVIKPGTGSGLDPFKGFSIGFFQLRPTSRGSVHARGTDAHQHPAIEPNYLRTSEDRAAVLRAIRLARTVIGQSPMAPYVVRETRPGIDVPDDEGLLSYIRDSGQTSFHPVGTCRMGDDAFAVVDASLRVRGVSGLRVVDSSVMPTIPSSNTNAASIMVGEKAADLMLTDRRAEKTTVVTTPVARADELVSS